MDRSHAERVRSRPGAGGKDEFDPERPRVRLTGRFKEANHPAATAMAGWALAPCVLSCIITHSLHDTFKSPAHSTHFIRRYSATRLVGYQPNLTSLHRPSGTVQPTLLAQVTIPNSSFFSFHFEHKIVKFFIFLPLSRTLCHFQIISISLSTSTVGCNINRSVLLAQIPKRHHNKTLPTSSMHQMPHSRHQHTPHCYNTNYTAAHSHLPI